MRKVLFVLLFVVAALVLVSGQSYAVSGQCSNCHTMHNSQGGVHVATGTVDGAPAYTKLLIGDCIGCHAQDPAAGADNGGTGTIPPQVALATASASLAGGNFSHASSAGNTAKGHNVTGLGIADPTLGNIPPGGVTMGARLTCSGQTTGCHGGRAVADQMSDLNGAHHANTNGVLNAATTVGNSYRFLLGVKGTEDADWQATVGAADHNEYFADNPDAAGFGISKLCAKCHPNFHSSANTGSAGNWTRHPVEVAIGASYATNYSATSVYDPTVPVARALGAAAVASYGTIAGTDTVMCLSCHQAHATSVNDSLRWAVSTTGSVAGSNTGCNKCHLK